MALGKVMIQDGGQPKLRKVFMELGFSLAQRKLLSTLFEPFQSRFDGAGIARKIQT